MKFLRDNDVIRNWSVSRNCIHNGEDTQLVFRPETCAAQCVWPMLGTITGLWREEITLLRITVRAVSIVDKNSSGDEIANVNFFYNIAHVEASAYAHWTSW